MVPSAVLGTRPLGTLGTLALREDPGPAGSQSARLPSALTDPLGLRSPRTSPCSGGNRGQTVWGESGTSAPLWPWPRRPWRAALQPGSLGLCTNQATAGANWASADAGHHPRQMGTGPPASAFPGSVLLPLPECPASGGGRWSWGFRTISSGCPCAKWGGEQLPPLGPTSRVCTCPVLSARHAGLALRGSSLGLRQGDPPRPAPQEIRVSLH